MFNLPSLQLTSNRVALLTGEKPFSAARATAHSSRPLEVRCPTNASPGEGPYGSEKADARISSNALRRSSSLIYEARGFMGWGFGDVAYCEVVEMKSAVSPCTFNNTNTLTYGSELAPGGKRRQTLGRSREK